MRKLTLALEDLAVESFDTSPAVREKGTVFGEQQCTCQSVCSCPGCPTCDVTCPNTCDDLTCAVTCYNTCDDYTCETCQGPSCQHTQCASEVYTCVCV
ncbi:MAG TPA: hypothetical protein VFR37_01105 [Longimicrobium sp.]|nr:hypothetical protein [Longimicrobium sp.]